MNWLKMPVIAQRIAKEPVVGTASAVKRKIVACVHRIVVHARVLVVAQMKQRAVASNQWHLAFVWLCRSAAQENGLRNAQMQRMTAGAAMESAAGRIQVQGVRKMALRRVSARKTPIAVKWNGRISVVDLPVSAWGAVEMVSVGLESPAAIVLLIAPVIRQPPCAMQRPANAWVSVGTERAIIMNPATPAPLNAGCVREAAVWPMRPRVVWTRTPWTVWELCLRVVSWMSGHRFA